MFMSENTNSLWRILPNYTFLHHRIGEQWVVYHSGSGDTHLLDEASMYIFNLLRAGNTLTEKDIVEKITIEYDDDSTKDLFDYSAKILEQLRQKDLVEKLG